MILETPFIRFPSRRRRKMLFLLILFITKTVISQPTPSPTPTPTQTFLPLPSPTPTPQHLGHGYDYLPPNVASNIATHERLRAWDFSFSYQPCKCDAESSGLFNKDQCPDGPGDTLVPSFSEPFCDYYTRMGGSLESNLFSSAGARGSGGSGATSGLGDTFWRYPDVSYLAEDSVRYQNYSTDFPSYNSRSSPIPPEVYSADFGVEVVSGHPARIRVVADKPLIRWSLNPHSIALPWKYTITVTIPANQTAFHLFNPPPTPSPSPIPSSSPSPSPSPSPFPSSSPSPQPSSSPSPIPSPSPSPSPPSSPLPSPSPSPSPIPPPSPSPAPSPVPSPLPPFSYSPSPTNRVFSRESPDAPPLPDAPPYRWQLTTGPLANLPGQFTRSTGGDGTEEVFSYTDSICDAGSFLPDCIRDYVKTVPHGPSATAKLTCTPSEATRNFFEDNGITEVQDRVTIEVGIETAQCKLHVIKRNPFLIQKMVVLGDFGEGRIREIVVPNIFTTTPIRYVSPQQMNQTQQPLFPTPSPTPFMPTPPAPSPSPTPILPFIFPTDEMNDPQIYTDFGRGGENLTDLDWRVIMSNFDAQPPAEALEDLFPDVSGGGIVVCSTPDSLKDACGTDPIGKYLPLTADGHGFWFFVNSTIMNWFLGTHGGSESAGTPAQLGIDAIQILSELEQRLDSGFYFNGGEAVAGVIPDFCNGEVQLTKNESTAEAGINGTYDGDLPFLFIEELHNWIVEHHVPPIPGVCGMAEQLIRSNPPLAGFAPTLLDSHIDGINFIEGNNWLPKGYVRDLSSTVNPALPGMISSYINSHLAQQVLFATEKGNWFVDGPHLYHRITDTDVHRALDLSAQLQTSGNPQGEWGGNHDLNDAIAKIERSSIINFLVDISESLLTYVASTSNAYFGSNATCSIYFTDAIKEADINGIITTRVCVPDFVSPGDPSTQNETENGDLFYFLEFNCTENMTILNGTEQETPPMAPGDCQDIKTDFIIDFEKLEDLNPNQTITLQGKAFSTACIIKLVNDINTSSFIVYDTTFVKCGADYDNICENLGLCDTGGFFDQHGFIIIVDIAILGLLVLLCLGLYTARSGDNPEDYKEK